MYRRSLESCSEGVGRFADIPNSRKAIANGQALPVAIRFRLLLAGVFDPMNGFL